MRFCLLICISVTLVAGLTTPVRLAAQDNKAKSPRYKLIDLGTFGGPSSLINPVGNGGSSINRRGRVVGSSQTSIPLSANNNGFVCVAGPDVYHAFEWGDNGVTDLGSLGNADNCSNAAAINDSGEIAGQSENGLIDPLTGLKQLRAVRWTDGHVENLGTFGGNHSAAFDVNKQGEIVGFALNKIPDPFSLFVFGIGSSTNGTQTRAFLWRNGKMRDLKTLGGPDAWAPFVNERGQVAGYSYANSTPNPTTGRPTLDPFLWDNGKMIDLGTLGGAYGLTFGLNNQGQVIGESSLAGDPAGCLIGDGANCDPFLWDGKKLIDMFTGGIGGNFVLANAINDVGEVAGTAAFPTHPFDAAIWRNGVVTDLGVLPGDCFSEALVLNSEGQVAGGSFPCDFSAEHAFLWENGTIFDLTTLISPQSGAQIVEPNAINDRGEIASDGLPPGCTDFNTCSHAYVLLPCDGENSYGQQCEEDVERAAPAIQNSAVTINQSPITLIEGGPTPREIAARINARFGRNRGLKARPGK